MNLESKIEAVLLFKNEPVSVKELSSFLEKKPEDVKTALKTLQEFYKDRGIIIVSDGEYFVFGTAPDEAGVIEKLQKEELSRELGRAGLETLAIILYRGPISRREIDQIRGVNSWFILRNLMIRGLIERTESVSGERSFSYKPTLKLFEYLGIKSREELPEFDTAFKKLDEFVKAQDKEEKDSSTNSE